MDKLNANFDKWPIEDQIISELAPFASVMPVELLPEYVASIIHTYVGSIGRSAQFSRTDFYANGAAVRIPSMVQAFDDRAAEAFVDCIKGSKILRDRIQNPTKLSRLRALGNIVLEKVSQGFAHRAILEALVDEKKEDVFVKMIVPSRLSPPPRRAK